ncbi:hypothetical protein ABH892_002995 [Paenibacillus sp. RC254]
MYKETCKQRKLVIQMTQRIYVSDSHFSSWTEAAVELELPV